MNTIMPEEIVNRFINRERLKEGYIPPFEIIGFRVIVGDLFVRNNPWSNKSRLPEAVINLKVKTEKILEVSEGNGPVNALDNALRKALLPHYPILEKVSLVDYNVHIIDGNKGTAAEVQVLISFSDGDNVWDTSGSSTDIIEASLIALVDGFEYVILKNDLQKAG